MEFQSHPSERLRIESMASRLTAEENRLRGWLMDYTIENRKPFRLDNRIPEHPPVPDPQYLLGRLVEKRVAVLDDRGNVNFIYPVSALPTNHRVSLPDGRDFFAMCAIDALGAAFTFGQDTRVRSNCSECGQAISVCVKDGKIADLSCPDTHALHVDLNRMDDWAASC